MTTGTTTAPTTPSTAPPQLRNRKRRNRLPLILIVPTLVLLVAALGYPIGWQVVTSFKQYGLMQQFGAPAPFVGLDNYVALVTDPYLWTVVVRSIVFCVVTAVVTVAIGGAMAVLMNALTAWPRIVLQVALLVAWAMPVVAAMTVWIWIVDWRRGLLNWALVKVGVDGAQGHNWLAEPLSFFVVASVIIVWMSVPFVALSIYAGLTQVSTEVLEAASLDGATGLQRLRFIIVPIIAPVLSIVMLLQLIWDLRVFTQIKLLQDAGGVTNETNLLGTYVYQLGTGKGDFGTASAVSILILALTIALSAYYVRSLMKEDV
ncbi:MAG TPA: sugar ABC transporter permease [Humibacillus xanthopallidus]|nr:sugar ABC transporter permease [Humibacillus xanthopallidus]HET7823153.1 sugar ABC transporter permease [Ornithinibacter sp.]